MRKRKEIISDFRLSLMDGFENLSKNQKLILEVLLDIRENLTKPNSRTIQSAKDEICDLHNIPISKCGCAGSLEDKAD